MENEDKLSDKLICDFINKEQISFAKWIVNLSIAIISFSFAYLLKSFAGFSYKWIFVAGLFLLMLSIIAGVRYVWVFLAGLGYGVVSKQSGKYQEKYNRLKHKYGYPMSRFYYEFLQLTFLLGLIFLGSFAILNFIIQK
jgi:hypothetical protein